MRKLIIAIAFGLIVTGVTMPIAIAQENTTTTQTPQQEDSSVIRLDENVVIKDYHFTNNGTIVVTLEADRVTLIKVSDMFVAGTGAQQIPTKQMTVSSGVSTIRMETTAYKGIQGVVIASPKGTVGITQSTGGYSFFEGTTARSNIVLAGIVGGLFSITLVVVVAFRRQVSISGNVEQEL